MPNLANSASLADFIRRWQHTTLNERQGSQRHFDELCATLGADPHDYHFEERVTTSAGRRGFADVWRQDHFALEYKSPGEDLQAAYHQLKGYSDELSNPPLASITRRAGSATIPACNCSPSSNCCPAQ